MSSFSKGSKRSAFSRVVLVLVAAVVLGAMVLLGVDLPLLIGSLVTFVLCFVGAYLGA